MAFALPQVCISLLYVNTSIHTTSVGSGTTHADGSKRVDCDCKSYLSLSFLRRFTLSIVSWGEACKSKYEFFTTQIRDLVDQVVRTVISSLLQQMVVHNA